MPPGPRSCPRRSAATGFVAGTGSPITMFTRLGRGNDDPRGHGAFRAADADGNDRDVCAQGQVRHSVLEHFYLRPRAPGAFGEHDERLSAREHGMASLKCLAVRPDRFTGNAPQARRRRPINLDFHTSSFTM